MLVRAGGVGRLGSPKRASGGAPPIGEITLSGTDFTYTQLQTGFVGSFSYGTAGRIKFPPGASFAQPGVLAFEFNGTGASMVMFQGASSQPTGMVEVQVDGGSFVSAGAASGGKYTLCSGLTDTTHTVLVRINSAYGTDGQTPTTGNILTITGSSPSVTLPRVNQMQTTGLTIMRSASTFDNAFSDLEVKIPGGVRSPGRVVNTFAPNSLRNTASFQFRTDATALWIYGEDTWCWINDGTTTTRYALNATTDINAQGARLTKLTGFSGTKNYTLWTAHRANMVVAPFDGEFYDVPATGTFDEIGDSISEFTSGNTPGQFGDAAVYQTAVALGRIGGNFGISGDSIAGVKARIDALLANKNITSKDVAFLTIGRNDTSGTYTTQRVDDYTYIVSALLAAGYGRIICRGILPEIGRPWTAENASISGIVSGFANAKIVFCDTSTFTGIDTHDQTHLTVTGANQLTAYQVAALPALIGAL